MFYGSMIHMLISHVCFLPDEATEEQLALAVVKTPPPRAVKAAAKSKVTPSKTSKPTKEKQDEPSKAKASKSSKTVSQPEETKAPSKRLRSKTTPAEADPEPAGSSNDSKALGWEMES